MIELQMSQVPQPCQCFAEGQHLMMLLLVGLLMASMKLSMPKAHVIEW